MNATNRFFQLSMPEQLAVALRLSSTAEGQVVLTELIEDDTVFDEFRVHLAGVVPLDAPRDLLLRIASTYLSNTSVHFKWLGLRTAVRAGLHELVDTIELLGGEKESVGWLSAQQLGPLAQRATEILRTRTADPTFGDEVT